MGYRDLKSFVVSIDYRDYMGSSSKIWALRCLFLYLCSYNLVGSVTDRARASPCRAQPCPCPCRAGRHVWKTIATSAGVHFFLLRDMVSICCLILFILIFWVPPKMSTSRFRSPSGHWPYVRSKVDLLFCFKKNVSKSWSPFFTRVQLTDRKKNIAHGSPSKKVRYTTAGAQPWMANIFWVYSLDPNILRHYRMVCCNGSIIKKWCVIEIVERCMKPIYA
jgi:hypothetical protein